MNLIVKICGLSTEETLDAALDAGADMVGLVAFPPSPRFVAAETAARLAARSCGRAEIVVLTVDMGEGELADLVATIKPDWLQFHGSEPPEAVASAKARFGLKVMKACGIRDGGDLLAARSYAAVADRLLLDAKAPKGAVLTGGRGVAFDWRILEGFDAGLPFMLSGGLDAGNVVQALAVSRAAGVDVSSGVETAPGRKDPDLIHGFVAAARRGERTASPAGVVEGVAP
jgi:phosphoribosylanthranilate isomerase